MTNEISKDTTNDIDFQSRKYKNADTKHYFPSQIYNKYVLKHCYTYFNRTITFAMLKSVKIILSDN